ncbi:MAG TPA: hypothetical protein VNT26_15100, partial [Candidatus Sulfotelmatobacter sp.]|nr:hypothetical protein [Candidatus Sulfotelmatobacter sp.]
MVVFAVAASLWSGVHAHAAATITNVVPVNVTPNSFGILWRSPNSTPSIAVFADAAGLTNLSSQLGIEAFPVHTGNPDLAPGYLRRQSQFALRAKTQSLGQMLMRVTGCQPGTTYYYQLTSTPPASSPIVYPVSGPLPSVTTEAENTFIVNAQQLILEVPGLDTLGQVVTLTHTNAAHPLAAVVGDGVNTNQVFFNANDLFTLASEGGNFAPIGDQTFTVDVLGPNQSDTLAQFTLTFNTNFTSGSGNQVTLGTEFLAITLGSTMLQTGQTSSVPVSFNSSVGIANVDLTLNLAPGHLTNFVLNSLAPEVDPAAVSVTAQGVSNIVLHLPARSGQLLFGGKQIAQFTFAAIASQPSAFVPLKLQQINATKAGSSLLTSNLFGASGRAVVVGREALLEAALQRNGTRIMTLYGKPYSSYALEYATNLTGPVV